MLKRRSILLFVILVFILLLSSCSEKCENKLIEHLVNSSWTYDATRTLLNEPDSFFENYEIYFDEGISIKFREIPKTTEYGWIGYSFTRNGKIENIVFNEKYTEDILTGIGVETERNEILKEFGKPDFSDDDIGVFGYIMDNFYIFFSKTEEGEKVSIYPQDDVDNMEPIQEAVELCLSDDASYELAEKLVDKLKIWKDFNYSFNIPEKARYSPRSKSVGIAYYSHGVRVFYSKEENNNPILKIYNNCSYKPVAIKNSNVEYIDEDFVFLQEKERIKSEAELKSRIEKEGKISPDKSRVVVDNNYSDGINVIHLKKDKADYCILTSPMQYGGAEWIDDRYIFYLYGKGEKRVYDLKENIYKKLDEEYVFGDEFHRNDEEWKKGKIASGEKCTVFNN